jgi:SAM-dependent methyltransferase
MRPRLSLPLLMRLQQARYLPLEWWDRLRGRHKPLVPPRWLRFVGGGDFDTVGCHFVRHFQQLASLRSDESVLDVGCGVGRIAAALTDFLKPPGSYHGFDIVREGIEWCQREITPQHPHFRFQHANVFNAAYNPRGRYAASDFAFPFAPASFDFVFLTSVFTHMLPEAMSHYLLEIRRVLRGSGRCFATFFILNDESRALMAKPPSLYNFHRDAGGFFTTSPDCPEVAVAYEEAVLRSHFDSAGFALKASYPGGWCGRDVSVDGQDIVLLSPTIPHSSPAPNS